MTQVYVVVEYSSVSLESYCAWLAEPLCVVQSVQQAQKEIEKREKDHTNRHFKFFDYINVPFTAESGRLPCGCAHIDVTEGMGHYDTCTSRR